MARADVGGPEEAAEGALERRSVAGVARRPSLRGHALVLLAVLTLLWGTNWPLFPIAMREISVWTFRAVSTLAAGIVLLAVARAMGFRLVVPRRHWPALVGAALLYLAIWNIASGYAAVLLPSGQAAVIGFTMPLWATLINWLLFGERPGPWLAVALVLGALAVLVLMLPTILASGRGAGISGILAVSGGFAWGLAAAIGWAAGTIVLKRGAIQVPAPVLTGWQLLIASVPITVIALFAGDHHYFMPTWTTVAAVSYITLVPMVIGNICWFRIVDLLPANVAGLSAILVPIVAMISGAIVLDEPLGPLQWLAMVLSTTAITIAMQSQRRRPSPARDAASVK